MLLNLLRNILGGCKCKSKFKSIHVTLRDGCARPGKDKPGVETSRMGGSTWTVQAGGRQVVVGGRCVGMGWRGGEGNRVFGKKDAWRQEGEERMWLRGKEGRGVY